MKLLIQRVSSASVTVDSKRVSAIGNGLLVYLGFENGDSKEEVEKGIKKILEFRIFEDEAGKMNVSLVDKPELELLLVSQFTLAAQTDSGRRPSFGKALEPVAAKDLYDYSLKYAGLQNIKCQGGVFQAYMKVESVNDGPATFWLEIHK